MPPNAPEDLSRTIETLYRSESGRILATLVRLLGNLDLAEETMHEAFAAALETWPQTGIPDKPRPWLISAGRFKAIDVMRRRRRFDAAQTDLALQLEARVRNAPREAPQEEEMEDDRLRLIFTCCHPALPSEGQVFAMGDNRTESADGRYWGFVPQQNIVGRPLFVYWSFETPADQMYKTSLGDRLGFMGHILVHFFDETRWRRTFHIVR